MDSSDRTETPGSIDPPASERLDTWKEVAAHLRRSVRTVQRWEREEGLPVRRHRHDKLGSIYAYKSELDAWWGTRGVLLHDSGIASAAPAPANDPGAESLAKTLAGIRKPAAFALAAAVIVVALILVAGLSRNPGAAAVWPADHNAHRLLIAELENRTGEPPVVASRLRDAIHEQMSASRFAAVVSADEIAEMLRLMKKPADTLVDAAVGREIALRDGAVDGIVTGAVEKTATQYVAAIRVLAPANANVLATFTVTARATGPLLEGVRRESARAQVVADDQLLHGQPSPEAPRVTTASLHAFSLYSRAAELMDHVPVKADAAFALLTEAIRVDPEFASAHILAAWALRNADRPKDEYLPHAERAFALASTTSEAERYFILGSFYQLTLDIDKSISAYEALLRLKPTHYWALGNLGRMYRAVGRHAAASEVRARQVAIRPRQFWGPYRMAEALLLKGDLDGARRYAAAAVNLVSQLDSGELQSRRSWFDVLPACEAWLRDDVAASARIAQELESTLATRAGADRNALMTSLGYWYLALGQRRAAERLFGRLPDSEGRLYHLAVSASHYKDADETQRYVGALSASTHPSYFMLGLPTLDAQMLPMARALVASWGKKIDEADAKLLQGQLALLQGDSRKARRLLEESIAAREDRFGAPALSASMGVASAWQSAGQREQAIHVLEEATQNRYRSCLWPTASAHLWVRMRRDLAHLYRQVGRESEAVAVEAQLRNLLKTADSPPVAAVRPAGVGSWTADDSRNH